MKANSITVILMMIIVSVTAFTNERQRMRHAALDRDNFELSVFCFGDTKTNFDRHDMRTGEHYYATAFSYYHISRSRAATSTDLSDRGDNVPTWGAC